MSNPTEQMQTRPDESVERPEPTRSRQTFTPRADVHETAEAIVVTADMPGVTESSVDITLEKNVLTIQGTVTTPERSGYKLSYGECEDGDYERSFALSEGVDRDKIEASVKDGVLQLTLPKSKEAASRKIAVKAG
jgi:HSP20 family molecular chaperone IbpA